MGRAFLALRLGSFVALAFLVLSPGPSMPRPHLRRVQPMVEAFCAERGVRYTQMSLGRSYRTVIDYLNREGLGDRDPFMCPLVAQHRL